MENPKRILDDINPQNLIELKIDAYNVKLKPCQVQKFVDDTQVEPLSQTSENSVSDSETSVMPKSHENEDIQTTPLLHGDNTEIPKRSSKNADDGSSHSSISFQNTFKKEMKSFKTFIQTVERKFEELKNVILDLPTKDKQSHEGEPDLVIELLKKQNICIDCQRSDHELCTKEKRYI